MKPILFYVFGIVNLMVFGSYIAYPIQHPDTWDRFGIYLSLLWGVTFTVHGITRAVIESSAHENGQVG